jgi:ATP-binding cassette, subfamily B, bacterial
VLDEATAHLDSESEAAVQTALDAALEGRTSIVIAHRLSTIRAADRILVVEDGRVVESGPHESLLEAGGLYAELYETQFRR